MRKETRATEVDIEKCIDKTGFGRFDLIVAEDSNQYPEHYNKLRENVIKAQRFSLVDEYESSVIEAFIT